MIPRTNGWGNLIKHARSHLGALLVLAIILMAILIASLYAPIPIIAKLICLGVIVTIITVFGIWIMIRTPKTPEGPLATEDFYSLTLALKYYKAYGINPQPETREDVMKKKALPPDTQLPPSKSPKQLSEGK